MLLENDLESYISERDLDKNHEANYRRSIRFFGDFLAHPATRDDLDEPVVNRWLHFIAQRRKPPTVMGHKRSITAIWNWLYEQHLVRAYDVRRLRRVKIEYPPPQAWTLTQTRILLDAAAVLPGRLRCGLDASQLMTAVVMLGYMSGLRLKDQRLLKPDDLSGTILSVLQNKTGHPHTIDIGVDATAALMPLIEVGGKHMIPVAERTLRTWTERLFAIAEANGFNKRERQGIGTLRKTGATEVARIGGLEAAARFLGHKGGTETARRHYVAPEALGQTPTPPSLVSAR